MNFEDKVLALFDNGRRSAVYVAGYQNARAQAASIAAEADRLIAEMAVENAELRERLSSLESLYRARDKDCAAKDAELERVRALPSKWREDGEKEEGDGEMGAAIACWCCANELEAALASPAAGITGTEQCVNGGTCGAGGFCDECEISPDSWQPDIEDQIGGGE